MGVNVQLNDLFQHNYEYMFCLVDLLTQLFHWKCVAL